MYEKSEIQNSYELVASQYAEAFFDELERKPFDRQLLDRFATCVGTQGQVWDIGCGPGQIARYLKMHGVDVTGFDLAEQMLVRARQLNPTIPFRQGNMLALPMESETLRGIVSFYAIIHLARVEVAQAMQEFWRVLQPGGYLLLAYHGGQGEINTTEWFGERVQVSVTLFTSEELERMVHDAGFVHVETLERPPYAFEYPTPRLYLFAQKPE